jgi:hypothetical protein
VIALPVGLLERVTDVNRDIDANFVDQSQRSHRHAPRHQRRIDPLRVHAAFEKSCSIEQVGKQNAVHQEPGAIAHDYRHFCDLAYKCQAPVARFV